MSIEFLTQPGESLLGAVPPQEAEYRFREFTEVTGVPANSVVVSFLIGIPLPLYPGEWAEGQRRWYGTKPEAMRNPLMWLPDRVAGRYAIEDSEGNTEMETLDEWAVRVALELMASDLYDDESGEWVDILAEHGLDADQPDVLARVQHWLDGGADSVLDSIDLTDAMTVVRAPGEEDDGNDPASWGVYQAAELIYEDGFQRTGDGFLRVMQWAVHAGGIHQWAEAVRTSGDLTIDEVQEEAQAIRDLSATLFAEMDDFKPHLAQWDILMEEWDGFEDSLRNRIVGRMSSSMAELEEFYGAQVAAYANDEPAPATDDFGFEN